MIFCTPNQFRHPATERGHLYQNQGDSSSKTTQTGGFFVYIVKERRSIMTYEQAVYFRLLLFCGYTEELDTFVDAALEKQDPITDIILNLAFCGSDLLRSLSVLKEYIQQANESEIYYDTVFQYVLPFLRRKYYDEKMPIDHLIDIMFQIAYGTDKYFDEPWRTMYLLSDYYEAAKSGYYYDMDDIMCKCNAFLQDGTALDPGKLQTVKKESGIKKWFHSVFKHKHR